MVRLVIVDDHLILLQGIRKLLEAEPGLQVVGEACDGREGVEVIRRLKPDIAILDITLPGLNGLDVARTVASDSPDFTVCHCRAFSCAGADPWSPSVIRAAVPSGTRRS